MATLTLDQKRLAQIRTQLYGKQSDLKPAKRAKNTNSVHQNNSNEPDPSPFPAYQAETYIKKDLTKVALFTTLILLMQFAVYYALTNKWLTINFYGISY